MRTPILCATLLGLVGALLLSWPTLDGRPGFAAGPSGANPTLPGPRAVATAQVPYPTGAGSSQVDVYYPLDGPPGPAVMILPSGLNGDHTNHIGHGRHLASHGYVVGVVHDVDIMDESDVAPNAGRARAALTALRAAPVVAGRLTGRSAVVGAHYNGLSAIRAAVEDGRFQAVAGLHPATFRPGGGGTASLRVPYLVMGGNVENGFLCPYGTTWLETLGKSAAVHSAGYLFAAAHPADFLDPPYDDLFDFCGRPRSEPFVWIKGLLTAWLDYYLRGDMAAYDWLYGPAGAPLKPTDVTDSQGRSAPQRLAAVPAGDDGLTARLSWAETITDTTTIEAVDLLRAVGDGPFAPLARVPLARSAHDDPGLAAGTTYRYTAAYRDRAGRQFQTAEPRVLVAGAATPTPSQTPRPSNTPGPSPTRTVAPTVTATLTRTPTPSQTPTRTPSPRVTASPGITPSATTGATAPPELRWRAWLPVGYREAR